MRMLCLCYSHTLSHLSRSLEVAKALRQQGVEVIFAGEGPELAHVRQWHFAVVPLAEPDPAVLFGAIRAKKLRFIAPALLKQMVSDDRALCEELRPDCVLSDGRLSAQLSCRSLHLPHMAICNVSSTPYRALPYIPFLSRGLRGTWWDRHLTRVNLALEMQLFDTFNPAFTRCSRVYGVAPAVTATNCLVGGSLTLLPDVERFFPIRNKPSTYHFVGPLTWQAPPTASPWQAQASGAERLVYATMGTTGVAEFFPAIQRAAAHTPHWFWLISTGGQYHIPAQLPANVWMADYVDGDLAAAQADIVVCHGGNGTVYQTLKQGKPVIGLPTLLDQTYNMRRVDALRLGKTMDLSLFLSDPSTLVVAIEHVLQDTHCQQAVQAFQQHLHQSAGPTLAAKLILQVMAC